MAKRRKSAWDTNALSDWEENRLQPEDDEEADGEPEYEPPCDHDTRCVDEEGNTFHL